MTTLPDVINSEQMIAINVDTQPFIDLIQKLNDMIKFHDQRFSQIDSKIMGLCTKDEFHRTVDPLTNQINELTDRSQKSLEQSEKLTQEAIENREKLTEMINNKFSEILITTQLNQQNATENLEQKIDSIMNTAKQAIITSRETQNENIKQSEMYKEIKSNVQILGERIHHVNTEFIKFANGQKAGNNQPRPVVRVIQQVAPQPGTDNQPIIVNQDNTELIEQLEAKTKQQIDAVQSSVADLLNDRLTSLQKALEVAVMHPTSDNSPKLNEVWAVTSQNRAALLNAMTEQSLLSRRVEVLQQMIDNIQHNPSNPESPNRPMLSSIMAHQNAANRASIPVPLDNDIRAKEQAKLVSTVDQLGGKMEGALQDILRIKNAVNRNEKDVRDVVLAIIDEFKLIRTNASGLEHLPPLNLATCVPSFFNNPSFTFDRVDSESESPYETDRSDSVERGPRAGRRPGERDFLRLRRGPSSDEEGNETAHGDSPRFHPKKLSGLLHLVSRPEPRVHENDNEKKVEQRIRDDPTELMNKSGRSAASTESAQKETEAKSQVYAPKDNNSPRRIEQSVVHVIDRQGLDELKQDMTEFHKNKDELMSVVDRKVDRVIVEKMFDKFRLIISGLNERIDEMSDNIAKMASQNDIQNITDALHDTISKVDKLQGASAIPIHQFGGKGEYIIGEDGTGAFMKSSNKSENYSELPPLKERKKL